MQWDHTSERSLTWVHADLVVCLTNCNIKGILVIVTLSMFC